MATMNEFRSLPRLSVKTTTGWSNPVSCNTPVRQTKAQVIYTTKDGQRKVFGESVARGKAMAIEQAWQNALDFFNKE